MNSKSKQLLTSITTAGMLVFCLNCSKPVLYTKSPISTFEECKFNIEQTIRETISYDGTFQDVLVERKFIRCSYVETQRAFFDIASTAVPTNKFVYFNNIARVEMSEKSGWVRIIILSKFEETLLDIHTRDKSKAKKFVDSIYTLSNQ